MNGQGKRSIKASKMELHVDVDDDDIRVIEIPGSISRSNQNIPSAHVLKRKFKERNLSNSFGPLSKRKKVTQDQDVTPQLNPTVLDDRSGSNANNRSHQIRTAARPPPAREPVQEVTKLNDHEKKLLSLYQRRQNVLSGTNGGPGEANTCQNGSGSSEGHDNPRHPSSANVTPSKISHTEGSHNTCQNGSGSSEGHDNPRHPSSANVTPSKISHTEGSHCKLIYMNGRRMTIGFIIQKLADIKEKQIKDNFMKKHNLVDQKLKLKPCVNLKDILLCKEQKLLINNKVKSNCEVIDICDVGPSVIDNERSPDPKPNPFRIKPISSLLDPSTNFVSSSPTHVVQSCNGAIPPSNNPASTPIFDDNFDLLMQEITKTSSNSNQRLLQTPTAYPVHPPGVSTSYSFTSATPNILQGPIIRSNLIIQKPQRGFTQNGGRGFRLPFPAPRYNTPFPNGPLAGSILAVRPRLQSVAPDQVSHASTPSCSLDNGEREFGVRLPITFIHQNLVQVYSLRFDFKTQNKPMRFFAQKNSNQMIMVTLCNYESAAKSQLTLCLRFDQSTINAKNIDTITLAPCGRCWHVLMHTEKTKPKAGPNGQLQFTWFYATGRTAIDICNTSAHLFVDPLTLDKLDVHFGKKHGIGLSSVAQARVLMMTRMQLSTNTGPSRPALAAATSSRPAHFGNLSEAREKIRARVHEQNFKMHQCVLRQQQLLQQPGISALQQQQHLQPLQEFGVLAPFVEMPATASDGVATSSTLSNTKAVQTNAVLTGFPAVSNSTSSSLAGQTFQKDIAAGPSSVQNAITHQAGPKCSKAKRKRSPPAKTKSTRPNTEYDELQEYLRRIREVQSWVPRQQRQQQQQPGIQRQLSEQVHLKQRHLQHQEIRQQKLLELAQDEEGSLIPALLVSTCMPEGTSWSMGVAQGKEPYFVFEGFTSSSCSSEEEDSDRDDRRYSKQRLNNGEHRMNSGGSKQEDSKNVGKGVVGAKLSSITSSNNFAGFCSGEEKISILKSKKLVIQLRKVKLIEDVIRDSSTSDYDDNDAETDNESCDKVEKVPVRKKLRIMEENTNCAGGEDSKDFNEQAKTNDGAKPVGGNDMKVPQSVSPVNHDGGCNSLAASNRDDAASKKEDANAAKNTKREPKITLQVRDKSEHGPVTRKTTLQLLTGRAAVRVNRLIVSQASFVELCLKQKIRQSSYIAMARQINHNVTDLRRTKEKECQDKQRRQAWALLKAYERRQNQFLLLYLWGLPAPPLEQATDLNELNHWNSLLSVVDGETYYRDLLVQQARQELQQLRNLRERVLKLRAAATLIKMGIGGLILENLPTSSSPLSGEAGGVSSYKKLEEEIRVLNEQEQKVIQQLRTKKLPLQVMSSGEPDFRPHRHGAFLDVTFNPFFAKPAPTIHDYLDILGICCDPELFFPHSLLGRLLDTSLSTLVPLNSGSLLPPSSQQTSPPPVSGNAEIGHHAAARRLSVNAVHREGVPPVTTVSFNASSDPVYSPSSNAVPTFTAAVHDGGTAATSTTTTSNSAVPVAVTLDSSTASEDSVRAIEADQSTEVEQEVQTLTSDEEILPPKSVFRLSQTRIPSDSERQRQVLEALLLLRDRVTAMKNTEENISEKIEFYDNLEDDYAKLCCYVTFTARLMDLYGELVSVKRKKVTQLKRQIQFVPKSGAEEYECGLKFNEGHDRLLEKKIEKLEKQLTDVESGNFSFLGRESADDVLKATEGSSRTPITLEGDDTNVTLATREQMSAMCSQLKGAITSLEGRYESHQMTLSSKQVQCNQLMAQILFVARKYKDLIKLDDTAGRTTSAALTSSGGASSCPPVVAGKPDIVVEAMHKDTASASLPAPKGAINSTNALGLLNLNDKAAANNYSDTIPASPVKVRQLKSPRLDDTTHPRSVVNTAPFAAACKSLPTDNGSVMVANFEKSATRSANHDEPISSLPVGDEASKVCETLSPVVALVTDTSALHLTTDDATYAAGVSVRPQASSVVSVSAVKSIVVCDTPRSIVDNAPPSYVAGSPPYTISAAVPTAIGGAPFPTMAGKLSHTAVDTVPPTMVGIVHPNMVGTVPPSMVGTMPPMMFGTATPTKIGIVPSTMLGLSPPTLTGVPPLTINGVLPPNLAVGPSLAQNSSPPNPLMTGAVTSLFTSRPISTLEHMELHLLTSLDEYKKAGEFIQFVTADTAKENAEKVVPDLAGDEISRIIGTEGDFTVFATLHGLLPLKQNFSAQSGEKAGDKPTVMENTDKGGGKSTSCVGRRGGSDTDECSDAAIDRAKAEMMRKKRPRKARKVVGQEPEGEGKGHEGDADDESSDMEMEELKKVAENERLDAAKAGGKVAEEGGKRKASEEGRDAANACGKEADGEGKKVGKSGDMCENDQREASKAGNRENKIIDKEHYVGNKNTENIDGTGLLGKGDSAEKKDNIQKIEKESVLVDPLKRIVVSAKERCDLHRQSVDETTVDKISKVNSNNPSRNLETDPSIRDKTAGLNDQVGAVTETNVYITAQVKVMSGGTGVDKSSEKKADVDANLKFDNLSLSGISHGSSLPPHSDADASTAQASVAPEKTKLDNLFYLGPKLFLPLTAPQATAAGLGQSCAVLPVEQRPLPAVLSTFPTETLPGNRDNSAPGRPCNTSNASVLRQYKQGFIPRTSHDLGSSVPPTNPASYRQCYVGDPQRVQRPLGHGSMGTNTARRFPVASMSPPNQFQHQNAWAIRGPGIRPVTPYRSPANSGLSNNSAFRLAPSNPYNSSGGLPNQGYIGAGSSYRGHANVRPSFVGGVVRGRPSFVGGTVRSRFPYQSMAGPPKQNFTLVGHINNPAIGTPPEQPPLCHQRAPITGRQSAPNTGSSSSLGHTVGSTLPAVHLNAVVGRSWEEVFQPQATITGCVSPQPGSVTDTTSSARTPRPLNKLPVLIPSRLPKTSLPLMQQADRREQSINTLSKPPSAPVTSRAHVGPSRGPAKKPLRMVRTNQKKRVEKEVGPNGTSKGRHQASSQPVFDVPDSNSGDSETEAKRGRPAKAGGRYSETTSLSATSSAEDNSDVLLCDDALGESDPEVVLL